MVLTIQNKIERRAGRVRFCTRTQRKTKILEDGVKIKFLRVSEVNNIDNVANLQRYIHYQHVSKRRKRKFKQIFPFFTRFYSFQPKTQRVQKKKHLLAIHEKPLVDFFHKSTTFSKCDENQIFFREGIAHPLNFFGIKSHDDPTSHRHLRSKRPTKNISQYCPDDLIESQ